MKSETKQNHNFVHGDCIKLLRQHTIFDKNDILEFVEKLTNDVSVFRQVFDNSVVGNIFMKWDDPNRPEWILLDKKTELNEDSYTISSNTQQEFFKFSRILAYRDMIEVSDERDRNFTIMLSDNDVWYIGRVHNGAIAPKMKQSTAESLVYDLNNDLFKL